MLNDDFHISSRIQPAKRGADTNIIEFLKSFDKFYYEVRSGGAPNLVKKVCDPYGFALLCEDCNKGVVNEEATCKENFTSEEEGEIYSYIGKFTFSQLINLLYRGYWFDYNLATNIYRMQHNALSIFKQIMNGRGYIMNRYAPHLKKVMKLMNHASESKICLNEKSIIPIPHIHRVCDGMAWPCLVSLNNDGLQLRYHEPTGNYGEGICITDSLGQVVDVLKINDLWLTELPLTNRLAFANSFIDLKPISYLKCWSLRSAFKAARLMNADSRNGVLIRPCHEDFFSNRWFEWNENSLIYCCKIKDKLTTFNTNTSVPSFYTLNGDEGLVNIREERRYEKMWLDDFDIGEFQQILKLDR